MRGFVWLCLFLPIYTTDSTELNLCQSNSAANVSFIINGSFHVTTSTINKCRCVMTTLSPVILNFQFFTVPVENCGSELRVTKTNGRAISMICQSSGSIEVGSNDKQVIVSLTKQPSPQNTSYSIQITSDYGNVSIQATCNISSEENMTTILTTITHATQNPNEDTSTTTQLDNTETSTLTTDNITSSNNSLFSSPNPTNPYFKRFVTENNNILYYAIGGGGGGVVVVIMLLVTVILYRRCSSKKSQENENTDDNEVDELQYNVFYVSSANCDNDKNTRNGEKTIVYTS